MKPIYHSFLTSYDICRQAYSKAKVPFLYRNDPPAFYKRYAEQLVHERRTLPAASRKERPLSMVGMVSDFDDTPRIVGEQIRDQLTNAEIAWYMANRPYYNLHPDLIPIFNKSRLNFPRRYIEFPYPAVVIQFPENTDCLSFTLPPIGDNTKPLNDDGTVTHHIQSCLFYRTYIDGINTIYLYIDFGQSSSGVIYTENGSAINNNAPTYMAQCFPWSDDHNDLNIEEFKDNDNQHFSNESPIPTETMNTLLRLVFSICFIAKDDSPLVIPHIIRDDLPDYYKAIADDNHDEATTLTLKSIKRRGQLGFQVGHDAIFDKGFIGPAVTGVVNDRTGRTLQYAHIKAGHWKLVRYGPQRQYGRIRWIMPYACGVGKPFKTSDDV